MTPESGQSGTLPKTNSSPLKIGHPKRKQILVSGSVRLILFLGHQWDSRKTHQKKIGKMVIPFGTVPLIINPIYTLQSGYLLGKSTFKGLLLWSELKLLLKGTLGISKWTSPKRWIKSGYPGAPPGTPRSRCHWRKIQMGRFLFVWPSFSAFEPWLVGLFALKKLRMKSKNDNIYI